MLAHATCVAIDGLGLLLRGAPGAGKSDLALRLMEDGAELVGDDQILLRAEAGQCLARPAEPLAGLLEVRGLGIVTVPHRAEAPVRVVIDLVARPEVERMPDLMRTELVGISLPLWRLCPWDASAPAKARLALRLATGERRLQP